MVETALGYLLPPPSAAEKDRRCAGSRVGPMKGESSTAEEVWGRSENRGGLAAIAVWPGGAALEPKDPFRLLFGGSDVKKC